MDELRKDDYTLSKEEEYAIMEAEADKDAKTAAVSDIIIDLLIN